MSFSAIILPVFVAIVIMSGLIKRIPVFDSFIQGAKQGYDTFVSLLPVLSGLMVAIYLLEASGGTDLLQRMLSPVFSILGIPREVVPLCILSPISGSGSLAVYESVLNTYGPDSFPGRVASVIAGSTETTFYALSVYFGSVGIKNYSAVVPCALLGDIVSFSFAALTVKLFFA